MNTLISKFANANENLRALFQLAEQEENREWESEVAAWRSKVEKATTFKIILTFKNKRDNGTFVEIFNVEGITNTRAIVASYRKIGFDIELKEIAVRIVECNTKVNRITFRYNN